MAQTPVDGAQGSPAGDNNGNPRKHRHWPPRDPPMFWATVAAFLGVCAYTWYAREQVNKSNEANEIADRNSYVTNRPYLMYDRVNPVAVVDPGQPIKEWRIGPVFTNYGSTAADNVTFHLCNPITTHTTATPNFECKFADKAMQSPPVGPRQPAFVLGAPVNVEDYDSTESGKTFLYIFGYVTYTDQLKPGRLHQTRFCSRVFKVSPPPFPPLPVGATGVTTTGCQDAAWVCFDEGCPPNWPGQ